MSKILFPVGRMIGGSLYKQQVRTDNFGKPKLDAAGQAVTGFDFGVAIPKAGTTDWRQTQWGAIIKAVAEQAWGAQSMAPTFAWKITDGDSIIPNKKNKRPCDREGYPGHWVVWFSQSWAPKLCNANGTEVLTQPDAIVPGYWVQVFGEVKGNGATNPSPGVFLNPDAVALSAYGERIEGQGVDVGAVGFGGQPLPAGASATPVAAMSAPQAASLAPPPAVVMPAVAPTVVTPNPAFLAPAPAAPSAPPVPSGPVMTAKANGVTYEAHIAAGWNDAQLREHGLMA